MYPLPIAETKIAAMVFNDDRLFPKFQGQDLHSREIARLDHRIRDSDKLKKA
ncbi:hypothetical protein H6F96_00020 [Microcoleus sp. FACHB-53]|nr:hypothetical protein [Microcoleus sp. FACHB-53]